MRGLLSKRQGERFGLGERTVSLRPLARFLAIATRFRGGKRYELVVTGRRKAEDYGKCEVLHQERSPNSFRRSFVLSEGIDGSRIAAKYENGILHPVLPKSEDLKQKKITIE